MHRIGEDRNERVDIVPAQLRVIVTIRPKYACRTCTDGVTQALSGLDIHRSTLADWMGVAGFHLGPVVDRLAEHLKTSTKLFMDETTGPVLDPGRGRTKTGYLWSLARDDRGWGGDDPPFTGSEIAAEGLRQIAEIYAIEKDIRGTSHGQRMSARQPPLARF